MNKSKFAQIVLCLLGMILNASCGSRHTAESHHKVLVLGIDGLDPQILEKFMSEGKLPHFQQLKNHGSFKPLATSIPPQSPVAWSNFITGMDPGGHGIFDFIHRDPKTLLPYLSTSQIEASTKTLEIGDWIIPLSSGEARLLRKGKAFWEFLSEHEIPATVIKMPANFPPVKTQAKSISGMGTPDLLGTYGTFTYFTDDGTEMDEDVSGGRVVMVEVADQMIRTELTGPPNPLKKGNPESKVDFTVRVDRENSVGKIELQGREILLNVGEWSPWLTVRFEFLPHFQSVSGIVRFFLKEVSPHFKLYVSPINLNPADPALPISTPEAYASEVCEATGYYYTQGMPEDTKALQTGVLDDGAYLKQARIILAEETKMLDYELDRFEQGFLFYYFSSVDQNCHVFWRATDPQHVTYSAEVNRQGGEVFEWLYQSMDAVIGRVLDKIADSNTTLIVMSDHGFAPFYRAFHLNTWLKDEGYLVLQDESPQGQADLFQNVDWRQTTAYALGLNGLYLNLRGRESTGIVQPGQQSEELLAEISKKLLALKDPQNGQAIFRRIYRATEIYHGPYVNQAPDLLTGFDRGYRVSWQTTLGGIPEEMIIDNNNKWSGDHCMAAELVPGVILSNKPIQKESPALYDLAPTFLQEFGIEKDERMIGSTIF